MSKTLIARQRTLYAWCTANDISPERLEALARRVRNTYCKYRSQYAADYRPSAQHEGAWNDAAMALTEAGAEVDAWVRAQFDAQEKIPYPTNLHGPAALAAYKSWMAADSEVDIGFQLRTYADIVRVWKATRPVREVLTDPRHGFPPLFVWCLARLAKLPDLAEHYTKLARSQLARPAYRNVYSQSFPDLISKTGEML